METKKMNGFEYFILGFKKYAVLKGRATRSEFWYFFLINFIILASSFIVLFEFSAIYLLLICIPSLAVGVRRIHDVGKNGKNILYLAIPFILFITTLILFISIMAILPPDAGMGFLPFLVLFGFASNAFIVLIIIAFIVLSIIFFAKKGQQGPNKYGSDPLAPEISTIPAPEMPSPTTPVSPIEEIP